MLTDDEIEKGKQVLAALPEGDDPTSWEFEGMQIEVIDDRDVDPDMEPFRHVWVPQGSELGSTNIVLRHNDEDAGRHCEYVQTAVQQYPQALETIEELRAQIEGLEEYYTGKRTY